MEECCYCLQNRELLSKMRKITSIGCADIHLFLDQTHIGKCIVVYNRGHKREWYELSNDEQVQFARAVSSVSQALKQVFCPDKINYAIYGDIVSHLHMHIVPKYRNGTDWGRPFNDYHEATYLSENEYAVRCEQIKQKILNLMNGGEDESSSS